MPVESMVARMPRDRSEAELRAWFLLPHDGHPSDLGHEVYAAAVHGLLRERAGLPARPRD